MRGVLLALGAAALVEVAGGAQGRGAGDALSAMADAERAFARMSVKQGQPEAFMAYFADEGVVFNPGPVNAREYYRQKVPAPGPRARVLDWEPAVADVALSEDLGFSTGPFTSTDTASGKRLAEGWFFSVWKRQPDRSWRVIVDLGVPAAGVGPLRPRTVDRATPKGVVRGQGDLDAQLRGVREIETTFGARVARGADGAYDVHTSDETRVYRSGHAPAVGPAAIRELVRGAAGPSCAPAQLGISSAGDFAYAYGTCEAIPDGSGVKAGKGGYVRVWRHTARGWMLAAEVVSIQ